MQHIKLTIFLQLVGLLPFSLYLGTDSSSRGQYCSITPYLLSSSIPYHPCILCKLCCTLASLVPVLDSSTIVYHSLQLKCQPISFLLLFLSGFQQQLSQLRLLSFCLCYFFLFILLFHLLFLVHYNNHFSMQFLLLLFTSFLPFPLPFFSFLCLLYPCTLLELESQSQNCPQISQSSFCSSLHITSVCLCICWSAQLLLIFVFIHLS